MNFRTTISRLSTYLLIAFAASTASASISGSTVATVLARERGIEVLPSSVHLQIENIECGGLHIASVRAIGRGLEVVLRCEHQKLPIIALVSQPAITTLPRLVATNASNVPLVVRPGAVVQLLIHGEKTRMKLPAICLEPGHMGSTVRVRIPGTHSVHLAKVVNFGIVVEDAA